MTPDRVPDVPGRDIRTVALVEEIDALESEIRRIRQRSKRITETTLAYAAGLSLVGIVGADGSTVMAVALGVVALAFLATVPGRRRAGKLERRRDRLIAQGSVVEGLPAAGGGV